MITDNFSMIIDGKNLNFIIKSPSLTDQREAQKVYNQAFSDAVKSGCIVRGRLDDLLKEQGLWDDAKQMKMNTLQRELLDSEKVLAKGGISINSAKGTANKMKETRDGLRELISVRTNLDNHTAEGQADNARFNYLVSCCLVYNDSKKPYFEGYDNYLNRASEPIAIKGAQLLANIMYGLDNDYEKKLPENKFLIKYKFVDEKLRYVNKDGKLVDEESRLVDENGRFINDKGEFVDKTGNLVDKNGDYVIEFEPFTDDDGNPIILDASNETKKEVETEKVEPPVPDVVAKPEDPQPILPVE